METHESAAVSATRPAPPEVEAGAASHTGQRAHNADALVIEEGAGLYAVADGMGDAPRSAAVARIALEALREMFLAPWSLLPAAERSPDEAAARLVLGVAQAQGRLYAPGRRRADRIGTTFAGVVVCGSALCIAGVGDSRVYLLRRGKARLTQITVDDTVLGEALWRGMPPEQAARLPNGHALTCLVGATAGVEASPEVRRWEPGDAVLLCTDGVSDRVGAEELAGILLDDGSAAEAAHEVVRRAVTGGGSDNATALVLRRSR